MDGHDEPVRHADAELLMDRIENARSQKSLTY
jgi:hypothetical protein